LVVFIGIVLLGAILLPIGISFFNDLGDNIRALRIGGLPTEAELAFDDYVQKTYTDRFDPHINYTIISESKATGNFEGDEKWCIVTDTKFHFGTNHFLLTRKQLYWGVRWTNEQQFFAEVGCNNW
jgi:hypothetical protein